MRQCFLERYSLLNFFWLEIKIVVFNERKKVRVEGLEPPCLAAPDPKSGTSTNFATPAYYFKKRGAKIYILKYHAL
jgi:hypothetical protein